MTPEFSTAIPTISEQLRFYWESFIPELPSTSCSVKAILILFLGKYTNLMQTK